MKSSEAISPPTGDPRHISHIRDGKVSAEINCRDNKRRRELGLPPIPTEEDAWIDEIREA